MSSNKLRRLKEPRNRTPESSGSPRSTGYPVRLQGRGGSGERILELGALAERLYVQQPASHVSSLFPTPLDKLREAWT